MFGLCLCCNVQEGTQSLPSGTQHSIDRGGGTDQRDSGSRTEGGWEPKGTDGWKRLKERIVRAEQTGEKEVTAAEKRDGETSEEWEQVNREERNGRSGGGGMEERRTDKSEEGLLTLAVSQAICVTMFHVLLKGWSAGNRDIMVSGGKQARLCRLATPNKVTRLKEKLLHKHSKHYTGSMCVSSEPETWSGIKEQLSVAPGA